MLESEFPLIFQNPLKVTNTTHTKKAHSASHEVRDMRLQCTPLHTHTFITRKLVGGQRFWQLETTDFKLYNRKQEKVPSFRLILGRFLSEPSIMPQKVSELPRGREK